MTESGIFRRRQVWHFPRRLTYGKATLALQEIHLGLLSNSGAVLGGPPGAEPLAGPNLGVFRLLGRIGLHKCRAPHSVKYFLLLNIFPTSQSNTTTYCTISENQLLFVLMHFSSLVLALHVVILLTRPILFWLQNQRTCSFIPSSYRYIMESLTSCYSIVR